MLPAPASEPVVELVLLTNIGVELAEVEFETAGSADMRVGEEEVTSEMFTTDGPLNTGIVDEVFTNIVGVECDDTVDETLVKATELVANRAVVFVQVGHSVLAVVEFTTTAEVLVHVGHSVFDKLGTVVFAACSIPDGKLDTEFTGRARIVLDIPEDVMFEEAREAVGSTPEDEFANDKTVDGGSKEEELDLGAIDETLMNARVVEFTETEDIVVLQVGHNVLVIMAEKVPLKNTDDDETTDNDVALEECSTLVTGEVVFSNEATALDGCRVLFVVATTDIFENVMEVEVTAGTDVELVHVGHNVLEIEAIVVFNVGSSDVTLENSVDELKRANVVLIRWDVDNGVGVTDEFTKAKEVEFTNWDEVLLIQVGHRVLDTDVFNVGSADVVTLEDRVDEFKR